MADVNPIYDDEEAPQRRRARMLAHMARRKGRLPEPMNCQECGVVARLEMHHEDYAKPLDVVWLCSPCHRAIRGLDPRRHVRRPPGSRSVTGKEVQQRRIALKLSIYALAKLAKIRWQSMKDIELERRIPRESTMRRILDALTEAEKDKVPS
jgi:DNA-binding XRE family transcriptional regulator